MSVYTEGRVASQIIDRIHQYSRIDGVILPDIGHTKQQFRSRTELFIGSHHHQLMGEIYDARSNVEHLHEYRYLARIIHEVWRLHCEGGDRAWLFVASARLNRLTISGSVMDQAASRPVRSKVHRAGRGQETGYLI